MRDNSRPGSFRYVLSGGTQFLALFLLGLAAVRVDLIARLIRRRATIVQPLVGALVSWAVFQYLNLHLNQRW